MVKLINFIQSLSLESKTFELVEQKKKLMVNLPTIFNYMFLSILFLMILIIFIIYIKSKNRIDSKSIL
jgi:uncharacterized membrane protein YqjE